MRATMSDAHQNNTKSGEDDCVYFCRFTPRRKVVLLHTIAFVVLCSSLQFLNYSMSPSLPLFSATCTNITNGPTLDASHVVRVPAGESHGIIRGQEMTKVKKTTTKTMKTYVTLSTTINNAARDEDYTYLAPLVARNWHLMGFVPIIFVVASEKTLIEQVVQVWGTILDLNATHIIPVVAENVLHHISIAQMSRLFGAALLGELDDDDFLCLTDADMMIMDPSPFRPSQKMVSTDTTITIFNGNCCRPQYPMHSVGMKVRTWRTLFPIPTRPNTLRANKSVAEEMVTHLLYLIEANFPGYLTEETFVNHGGRHWGMDQALMASTIDARVSHQETNSSYTVELTPGPKRRQAVGKPGYTDFTDVHLASFNLDRHGKWLDDFVSKSAILAGHEQEYKEYTKAWQDFRTTTFST